MRGRGVFAGPIASTGQGIHERKAEMKRSKQLFDFTFLGKYRRVVFFGTTCGYF